MQVIENHELFSELSNDESAAVSGGREAAAANALAGFLALPGNGVTITPQNAQTVIAVNLVP